GHDKRERLPNRSGGFSCKSSFHNLSETDEFVDFDPYWLVWKSPFP
ncbi:LOW QUALITY PROTEIN: hypothetical protein TorRG33x02_182920, partial [Trema orientale]